MCYVDFCFRIVIVLKSPDHLDPEARSDVPRTGRTCSTCIHQYASRSTNALPSDQHDEVGRQG